jgi:hypothetical protein
MMAAHRKLVTASSAALGLVLVACGSTPAGPAPTAAPPGPPTAASSQDSVPETNPPGDIPDSQVFVPFTMPDGVAKLTVPEGWAQSGDGRAIVFTDKLLSVRIETRSAASAPTVASATATDVPQLRSSVSHYQPGKVSADTRTAGPVVVITYGAAAPPDPVTGKTVAQDVQRYLYWRGGHELVLTLSAPTGTDTVDAWRTITDSVSLP